MENNFQIEVKTSTLLDLNKHYISKIVEHAKLRLDNGEVDELTTFVTAKKGLELFTQLEKAVRPYAEEKSRLGKGEVYSLHGVELTEKMTGVSYDFTNCDDEEWNTLTEQINSLTEKRKEREKFLKTITKPIFDENGVQINPPIHKGRLGLNVRIK